MMRVPGGERQPAGGQGARRRRALRLLAARRAAARGRDTPTSRSCSSRVGLRDHRAVDGGHAAARPRAGRRPTSACSATTSRSCRRSRPSSSRPTCASTASSARATSRRWSGNRPYRFVPEEYGKPLVTAGFEPLDILAGRSRCCSPRSARAAARSRTSTRGSSRDEGNPRRSPLLAEVFELRPHFEWRGLGFISQSALQAADAEFAEFDAELRYVDAGRAGGRPEGVPVRRGAEGRASSRGSARCSAPRAPRRRRSARAWCRRRARARRTTTSAGCTARRRSLSAGLAERRPPSSPLTPTPPTRWATAGRRRASARPRPRSGRRRGGSPAPGPTCRCSPG